MILSTTLFSQDKIIYLTFDDGPLYGTRTVLNILKEEDIEATMFFVGRHAQRNKKIFNYAKDFSNIVIGNHTFSHADGSYAKFYRNPEKLIADIDKAQNILCNTKYQRLAGRNVWRMPEVSRNDYAIKKKRRRRESLAYDRVYDAGYFIYGWDVEWRFNHKNHKALESPQKMASRINYAYTRNKTKRKGKVVMLAHDFMFKKRAGGGRNLRKLIKILKRDGWKFETIETYSDQRPEDFLNISNIDGLKEIKYRDQIKKEEKSCKRDDSATNNTSGEILKDNFLEYFDKDTEKVNKKKEENDDFEEDYEIIIIDD